MKKIILVLFLIFYTNVFANPVVDSLLTTGLDLAYNFKLEKAERVFMQLIKEDPSDPIGYYFISKIHLWKFVGSKSESEYIIFKNYSEKALNVAEDKPESAYNYFMLGEIHQLEAMASGAKSEVLDAFWASKNSIGYYEDALDLDPTFYDAYLGLGVFNYALSYVPGVFNWALVLTGISGDKDESLENLKLAYKYGNLMKTESGFYLGKVYTEYTAEYDSAEIYLSAILEKYPNNIMFRYQNAILNERRLKFDEAIRDLTFIINSTNQDLKQIIAFSYFILGNIYYRQNEFSDAIEYYNLFIENAVQVEYTGIANYRIAICNAMLNNKLEFQRHLILAGSGNEEIPDDRFAIRKSKHIFDKKFNETDKNLIMAKNSLFRGEHKKSLKLLNPVLKNLSGEEKGLAFYILAEAYFGLKKFGNSLKYLNKAKLIEYKIEKWIEPRLNLLSAKINFEQNDFDRVEFFLDEAEDVNEYLDKDILNSKINFYRRRIN